MNSDAYREFLLKSIPTAVSASGGKEVNCRCLYCPDSRDPKSKHMYISIPQSDSEPSLYNCYKDNEELYKTLKKTYSLLKENGKLVIDCFNKSWRDSIDKDFYKELYIDENYKLIIRRDYDFKTGNELTVYELYRENIKIKDFTFVQKFFEIDDILDILDNKWSYNLANSNDSQTRNNSQKHIMILRKK